MNSHITSLYRYPVKGLSGERLAEVALVPGEPLPFDRSYAIENGPGLFDDAAPRHLPKVTFLCLMRNERLARLTTTFDTNSQTLTLSRGGEILAEGCLSKPDGRRAVERFMADDMAGDLRGPPRVVSAPGHSFSDVREKCVHIVNLASLRVLEAEMGRPLDPLRFRPNIIVDGLPAWAELDLVGRDVRVGEVTLRVFKRTVRCPATDVNPQTAQRDARVPDALAQLLGHRDFGVYAMVSTPGVLREGDTLAET
jgi:uncharacterized protein